MGRSIPHARVAGLQDPHRGLTAREASDRTQQYGANIILEAPPGRWWLARETLKDPMLWFLLGTSLLFALVDEWTEAGILLVALVPLLGMDAYLHRRTRASVEGLSARLATQAQVVRDSAVHAVNAEEIVPGDLVHVEAGAFFPADGVLVAGENIQIDESTLTGEALPVRKEVLISWPASADEAVHVGDSSWSSAGTRLLTGRATVRIVFTGAETLYGEIVRSAVHGVHERTPLQSAVGSLVTILLVAAAALCIALAWVRIVQGHGWLDALLSAVTLAVAALPEEFPVVLTFFLGVGVYRLARRQALVRRAVVVENIGRVTCICTDKTGTLTAGRLSLTHHYPAPDLDADRLQQIAAWASRRETGDPMDIAILESATPAVEVAASFPFTEDRKRETGIIRENGRLVAAVKGAPEVVLGLCQLAAVERERWLARVEELAGTGHKVVACAWQDISADAWHGGEPDRDFRFAGLLAFEDPVRPGVREALAQCLAAHIHVIMVTGDHPATARAVAHDIGLGGHAPRIVQGDELEARLARGDSSIVSEVDVIARAVPAQKLALVRALQAMGEIVAVTGDGVNDVPALQAADIGIAMGERGTRSAREVAAIVLLDDNFRSIARAIAEGRQLFTNLQLSFQYLLMIHLPLVLAATFIPLAGYPLLFLPVHVVWLEMVIHPTALLVFQNLPSRTLARIQTHRVQVRFFTTGQWVVIVAAGSLITLLVVASYLRSLGVGYEVEHARAMALAALTAASAGLTAWLSRMHGLAARMMIGATILASLVLIQVPSLAAALHLAPLHLDDWLLAIGGGLLVSLAAAIPLGSRQP